MGLVVGGRFAMHLSVVKHIVRFQRECIKPCGSSASSGLAPALCMEQLQLIWRHTLHPDNFRHAVANCACMDCRLCWWTS
jgi:hypothetical protein